MLDFRSYAHQLIENFHLYFNHCLERCDIEDIHQLRVTIKKLRAVIGLIEMTSGEDDLKASFESFISAIFAEAGKLREDQINIALITQYNHMNLDPYERYLQSSEKGHQLKLQEELIDFKSAGFKKFCKELLDQAAKTRLEHNVQISKEFINVKIQKVEALLTREMDEKKLHKIRIHLKAVQEILSMIKTIQSEDDLSSQSESLKAINHNLGDWHDLVMLLESIDLFEESADDQNPLGDIKVLYNRLKVESEIQMRRAIDDINGELPGLNRPLVDSH